MPTQKTFMDYVEKTTDHLETIIPQTPPPEIPKNQSEPQEPQISLQFKPKHDMRLEHEVKDRLIKIWDTTRYSADFERFLDLTLAALERREDDYMSIVKNIDKSEGQAYCKMYAELSNYFLDGNYGDPLGSFYMEHFSHGRNGEFYTPWNVALMMAKMINPTPEEVMIDPTCGSGIMMLAARYVIHENYGWLTSSRYGRNLYGMDISGKAVKMAKINMYLTDYVYMICLINEVVYEIQNKIRSESNGNTCENNA